MSRSYKKNPVMKSDSNKTFAKRQAAKKVRHADDVGDGGNYKKLGDSYEINDYIARLFREKDKWWFRKKHQEYKIKRK